MIVVSRAYVDQLCEKAIDRSVPQRSDGAESRRRASHRSGEKCGRHPRELDRLATQLEADAASAPVARDATRLRSLQAA